MYTYSLSLVHIFDANTRKNRCKQAVSATQMHMQGMENFHFLSFAFVPTFVFHMCEPGLMQMHTQMQATKG